MTPLDYTEESRPMPYTARELTAEPSPSAPDLPYGPLPVRQDQPIASQSGSGDPDPRLTDPGLVAGQEPEPSSELEIAAPRDEVDDDVHFGVAAKALGVSRKTVERMVKRGQLARGPSGVPATVSKRSLVGVFEERRREVGHLTRATEVAHPQSAADSLGAVWPVEASTELQELLRPVLEPLLEEFVAARSRAAVLESQIESLTSRATQERARDELLIALATGNWRQRRRARKGSLRYFVLRDRISPPNS
jgi:hypothetical protein